MRIDEIVEGEKVLRGNETDWYQYGNGKKAEPVFHIKSYQSDGTNIEKGIACTLGLTPAAVTQICAEFMTRGLLVETGTLAGIKPCRAEKGACGYQL